MGLDQPYLHPGTEWRRIICRLRCPSGLLRLAQLHAIAKLTGSFVTQDFDLPAGIVFICTQSEYSSADTGTLKA